MKTWSARFNLYLLGVSLAVGAGCATSPAKKKEKEISTLRLFLESPTAGPDQSRVVVVHRENPVSVKVEKEPFAHEGDIVAASVENGFGGFYIKVQLGRHGTWVLENMSASHIGRRVAVFAQFPEERWLAAPVLSHRLSDGVFAFTPDATREEAERIVHGLNNVAAKMKKKDAF